LTYDLCIVDEASKATATEVLVPLVRARRWILVGDDHQLPPFQDDALRDHQLLNRFGLVPADVSGTLFSVLAEGLPEACRIALTHQHRMHPAIGELISECFYGGQLTSSPREMSRIVQQAFGAPVLWADTSELPNRRERESGSSFVNLPEAEIVERLVDRLQLCASAAQTTLRVAVLAGYGAQRDQLGRRLQRCKLDRTALDVVVNTIDAFQGKEADVAIFSVTRSNPDGRVGFIDSPQRVNVALSRARDGLAIVGDLDFVRRAGIDPNPLGEVIRFIERVPSATVERFNAEELSGQ
jgi:superfamily I DNA and/or RNA helicase